MFKKAYQKVSIFEDEEIVDQSTNQSNNQILTDEDDAIQLTSIKQSNNQSIDQPLTKQTLDQQLDVLRVFFETINQSINQSILLMIFNRSRLCFNGYMRRKLNQSSNQSINQSKYQFRFASLSDLSSIELQPKTEQSDEKSDDQSHNESISVSLMDYIVKQVYEFDLPKLQQSISQTNKQSINQFLNQSSKSTNRSVIDQLSSQSINRVNSQSLLHSLSINQSTNPSINQIDWHNLNRQSFLSPTKHRQTFRLIDQTINQTIKQCSHSDSPSNNQSINLSINQFISIFYHFIQDFRYSEIKLGLIDQSNNQTISQSDEEDVEVAKISDWISHDSANESDDEVETLDLNEVIGDNPINQSNKQSINQTNNQTSNPPSNQTINQSINQSDDDRSLSAHFADVDLDGSVDQANHRSINLSNDQSDEEVELELSSGGW